MEEKRYLYFISYEIYKTDGTMARGWVDISFPLIKNGQDLIEIQESIKLDLEKRKEYTSKILILNWKRFEE